MGSKRQRHAARVARQSVGAEPGWVSTRDLAGGFDFLDPLYDMADASDRHPVEIVDRFMSEHRFSPEQYLAVIVLGLTLLVFQHRASGERLSDLDVEDHA